MVKKLDIVYCFLSELDRASIEVVIVSLKQFIVVVIIPKTRTIVELSEHRGTNLHIL